MKRHQCDEHLETEAKAGVIGTRARRCGDSTQVVQGLAQQIDIRTWPCEIGRGIDVRLNIGRAGSRDRQAKLDVDVLPLEKAAARGGMTWNRRGTPLASEFRVAGINDAALVPRAFQVGNTQKRDDVMEGLAQIYAEQKLRGEQEAFRSGEIEQSETKRALLYPRRVVRRLERSAIVRS